MGWHHLLGYGCKGADGRGAGFPFSEPRLEAVPQNTSQGNGVGRIRNILNLYLTIAQRLDDQRAVTFAFRTGKLYGPF